MYPLGGQTSLHYGMASKVEGVGLSTAELNKVIDFPARDMTVTVEAGITMSKLAETLAAERLRLPVDVPQSDVATLGGVVATDFNGPRRYGAGTVRDYVIGISAIDGTGTPFKGGGRVVKNVAGYDFCKLLTGSLGTLGVISQLTLKLNPIPSSFRILSCQPNSLDNAETLLADLVRSTVTPSAVELVTGSHWSTLLSGDADDLHLLVALEGTELETDWMAQQLSQQWRESGIRFIQDLTGDEAKSAWSELVEFPASESPLVVKASVRPSGVTKFIEAVQNTKCSCNIQAHAGNGVVIVSFDEFPAVGLSRMLLGAVQPAALALQGSLVVLSNPSGGEMTHQAAWGGNDIPFELMTSIKQQFDPNNLFNPGRYVYV